MAKHYIIMSSSYADGTRIAFDITDEGMLNSARIQTIIREIRERCGQDVPLSTHLIETDTASWDSVKEYDPFFADVELAETVSSFIQKIKKGRVLSGLDVANYILSKVKCTHLSLEKLVYLAYADYLCEYSSRLFVDKIYAFRYGPAVNSVYETYKRRGYSYIDFPHDDLSTDIELNSDIKEMPAKSRILFAKEGSRKLLSIDQTIEKYGKYSASTLVEITHREGSPWSRVDSSKYYQLIPDKLIEKYHDIEVIK